MIEIVRIDPPFEPGQDLDNGPRTVYLRGEMENVEVDDEIFGYMVTKIQAGRHDGFIATQFTLADSLGEREVGRLIIRNDAYQDAQPEWTRYFPEPQGTHGEARLEDFLYEASMLEDIPAGFHFVPARKIDVGDIIRDEMNGFSHDSTVINVRYGTGTAESSGLAQVVAGEPMVELKLDHGPKGGQSNWLPYGLGKLIARKS